jgi:hypothetical protein
MNFFKFLLTAAISGSLMMTQGAFAAVVPDMTQIVAGGGVTAKVTYLNPKSNDDPRFQVVLETHSVNLDAYDFKNITIVRDDAGKIYSPVGVETKGGGHHREATLVFPNLSRDANRVELVVRDVAGVKERTFRWDLK